MMSSTSVPQLPGTTPAHLTSSTEAGRGRDLLCRDVLVPSFGLRVRTTGYSQGDAEWPGMQWVDGECNIVY